MSVVSFVFPSYASSERMTIISNSTYAPEDNHGNLKCVIRTDADVATEFLRKNIVQATGLSQEKVSSIVNQNYERWGKQVVGLIGKNLDYDAYGHHIKTRSLQVHFYRSAQSSECVVYNAMDLLKGDALAQDSKYVMVSLDDMIRPEGNNSLDLAFSRKFDRNGKIELGYVARPGFEDLSVQIERIKNKVSELSQVSSGARVPLVFLEDNIRRSKMINWVVSELESAGVFEKAYLAGISTCFCSADVNERKKIQFEGKSVPIVTVAHYNHQSSDVMTPRDLFFDGLVVDIDGHVGRLPAIFMDLVARFKIAPDYQESFRSDVALANIDFCMNIQKEVGVHIPLSWMEHGETISRALDIDKDVLVVDVMKSFVGTHQISTPNLNDNLLGNRTIAFV